MHAPVLPNHPLPHVQSSTSTPKIPTTFYTLSTPPNSCQSQPQIQMCYHNYTQYSGCGHHDELRPSRYTLCPSAYALLLANRGPQSTPPNPPPQQDYFSPTPPSRGTATRSRSFFGLVRANTETGTSRVPGASKREGKVQVTSAKAGGKGVPEHEIRPVRLPCIIPLSVLPVRF